jgi:hypothetical protein
MAPYTKLSDMLIRVATSSTVIIAGGAVASWGMLMAADSR